MEIILWRHAHAEDGAADMERDLTAKGQKQAARVAAWLRARLPQDFLVLSSPARRARQTAEALGAPIDIVRRIAPGAAAAEVLAAARWPHGQRTVVVVGHQPTLGCAAALLATGSERAWSLRKGGLWWIAGRERAGDAGIVVRAVIAPDLI